MSTTLRAQPVRRTVRRVSRGLSATFTDAWKLQQENCEARHECDYIGAGG